MTTRYGQYPGMHAFSSVTVMEVSLIAVKMVGVLLAAIGGPKIIIRWIDPDSERRRKAKRSVIARMKSELVSRFEQLDKRFPKWGLANVLFFFLPLLLFAPLLFWPTNVLSGFRSPQRGLHPWYFFPSEFVDVKSLAEKLKPETTNEPNRYLFANLSPKTMTTLAECRGKEPPRSVEQALKKELAHDFNEIITANAFLAARSNGIFSGVNQLEDTLALQRAKASEVDLFRLHKALVQDAFPSEIEPRIQPRSAGMIFRILATILVYFMQFGFIAFEAGEVHKSYRLGSAVKNLLVFVVAFGSYVTFGPYFQGLCGNRVLGHQPILDLAFHAGFASTVALLVANALTERTSGSTNLLLAAVSAGFGYPVLSGLLWANGSLFEQGFTDAAGACVVHMFGAVIGLYSAWFVGATFRTQAWYFLDKPQEPDQRSLIPLTVVGGLFLWFGWLGFNSGNSSTTAELQNAFLNTSLGAVGGALAAITIYLIASRHIRETRRGYRSGVPATVLAMADLDRVVVGAMGGLVCVTANASHVTRLDAIFESFIGGRLAVLGSSLLSGRQRKRVDDPLGAVATHGCAGFVGIVLTPFLMEGGERPWKHLLIQLQGCAVAVLLGCLIVVSVRVLVWLFVHYAKDRCNNGQRAAWWIRLFRLRLSSHRQATGKEGFEVLGPPAHFPVDEAKIIRCFLDSNWNEKTAGVVGQYLMAEERSVSADICKELQSVLRQASPKYDQRERFALVAVVLLNVGRSLETLKGLLDLIEQCLVLEASSKGRGPASSEIDRINDIVKSVLSSNTVAGVNLSSGGSSDASRGNPADSIKGDSSQEEASKFSPPLDKLPEREVERLLRLPTFLPKDLRERLKRHGIWDEDKLGGIASEVKVWLSVQACAGLEALSQKEIADLARLFEKLTSEQITKLLNDLAALKEEMERNRRMITNIEKYRAALVWTIAYLAEELATSDRIVPNDTSSEQVRAIALFNKMHGVLTSLHKENSGECRVVRRLAWIGSVDLEFPALGSKVSGRQGPYFCKCLANNP